MALWDNEDDLTFEVVANADGRYSVWPAARRLPAGWHRQGFSGSHQTCLDEIDRRPPGSAAYEQTTRVAAETAQFGPEAAALAGPFRARPEAAIVDLIRDRDVPMDHPGASCGPDHVTRGELLEGSRAWARVLTAVGCGREVPVAVLLPRGLDALTAILAVLDAGAAFVPLSIDEHPDRLHTIIEESGVAVVVTTDELASRMYPVSATVLTVGELAARARTATAQLRAAAPEDLAYIFYTSGSTGEPKGVEGTHAQLSNYALWCRDAFGLTPDENVFLSASLHFLGSLTTIFTPLLTGCKITIVPEGASTDELLELSRHVDGGLLKVTPTHLRMLTARGVPAAGLARRLMVGSEPLTFTRELSDWMGSDPRRVVVNHYGLTETHGCFCHWLSGTEEIGSRAPIGRPIDNVAAYIVDRGGELVDVDEVGELLVGGPSLGRGYRRRPGLTAARWIPNPWGPAGSLLLRTGDLARMDADGVVTVLGRADRQVKIRGHRVEPAAVEEALRQAGRVKEALVLPRVEGDRVTLEAYLLRNGDDDVDVVALRGDLERRFPPQWVPARVAVLSEFPVNANGKIDRCALPEPRPFDGSGRRGDAQTRWSRTEVVVATAFCEVLEIEQIGLTDGFFELGGDSLSAVEVAARVGRMLHREVPAPAADVTTVREYAHLLTASDPDPVATP